MLQMLCPSVAAPLYLQLLILLHTKAPGIFPLGTLSPHHHHLVTSVPSYKWLDTHTPQQTLGGIRQYPVSSRRAKTQKVNLADTETNSGHHGNRGTSEGGGREAFLRAGAQTYCVQLMLAEKTSPQRSLHIADKYSQTGLRRSQGGGRGPHTSVW